MMKNGSQAHSRPEKHASDSFQNAH